ncbi:hypothetical protein GGR59_002460 [Xanthomonas arboricola]|nr:hypothetical protein [Xanthomonas arboricola]
MDRITTSRRGALTFAVLCILVCAHGAAAQSMRSATGKATHTYIPPVRQPHNSMARDTTPFNCEQYRTHPHPGMVRYCQGVENMTLRSEAQRQGRPAPSIPSSRCLAWTPQKPNSWVMGVWAGKR